jgi:hypothetical protein
MLVETLTPTASDTASRKAVVIEGIFFIDLILLSTENWFGTAAAPP